MAANVTCEFLKVYLYIMVQCSHEGEWDKCRDRCLSDFRVL